MIYEFIRIVSFIFSENDYKKNNQIIILLLLNFICFKSLKSNCYLVECCMLHLKLF